jgi:hypothetical protein
MRNPQLGQPISKVQFEHLRNTGLKRYRYVTLLGKICNLSKDLLTVILAGDE